MEDFSCNELLTLEQNVILKKNKKITPQLKWVENTGNGISKKSRSDLKIYFFF